MSSTHTLAKLGKDGEAQRRREEGTCCSLAALWKDKMRIKGLFLSDMDSTRETKGREEERGGEERGGEGKRGEEGRGDRRGEISRDIT